jgi:hypothetical protein
VKYYPRGFLQPVREFKFDVEARRTRGMDIIQMLEEAFKEHLPAYL